MVYIKQITLIYTLEADVCLNTHSYNSMQNDSTALPLCLLLSLLPFLSFWEPLVLFIVSTILSFPDVMKVEPYRIHAFGWISH